MLLANEYSNFKMKAHERFWKMTEVIAKQKQNERDQNIKSGLSPYMGTLMSTLTTENMKQYNNIADNYPYCKTPSKSGISTPEQTSGQARNHLDNLSAIASVPAPKRLMAFDADIGREVEARKQANAVAIT